MSDKFYIRHPQSWKPESVTEWRGGYKSLEDLQQQLSARHRAAHPPAEFNPAWMICPTICKCIPNGVELWKWNISREAWLLDCEITVRSE